MRSALLRVEYSSVVMAAVPIALGEPPVLPAADRRRLGAHHLRLLALADRDAVLALRDEVLAQLDHPDHYVREDDEDAFVRMHLPGHAACRGETIGVFDDRDRLVGYAMLGLPDAASPDNLGRCLPPRDRELHETAHLASCMIAPAHRGHALQRTLLAARFTLALAHARPLCVAMVSLHNHASRRNLLRAGLRIAYAGNVQGLRRHLIAIDLERPWRYDMGQAQLVECLDYDRQCVLTRAGYHGIADVPGGVPDWLVFAHVRPHAAPR
jgi:hypothetical protein